MADTTTGVQVFVGPANQLELGDVVTGPPGATLETISETRQRLNLSIPSPTQELVDSAAASEIAAEAAAADANTAKGAAEQAKAEAALAARAPTNAQVQEAVDAKVPPAVTAALAADSAPQNAAAAAVAQKLEEANVQTVQKIGNEDFAFGYADSNKRRSWLEIAKDGGPTDHSAGIIFEKIAPSVAAEVTAGVAETTGITEFSDYAGWAWGVRDQQHKVALGVRTDGTVYPEQDYAAPDLLIKNAIHEWWIEPVATWQNTPYPRLVGGAYSKSGDIVVYEMPMHGPVKSVVVGKTAAVDDHNAPAVFEIGPGRLGVMWQEHNVDNLLKFVVGDADGSLQSLANNPVQSINIGGQCSYEQIAKVRHLSDSTQWTHRILTRRGSNDWGYLDISFAFATTAVSVAKAYATLLSAGGQSYIHAAEANNPTGNQVMRLAWGYNPEAASHTVSYLDWDFVTGALSSPSEPGFSANAATGAGLPIIPASAAPVLAEPATGWSRRLYYCRPGPYRPGIAYADYQQGAWATTAELKVVEWTGAAWVSRSYGLIGLNFSSTNESYGGGPGFPNPCHNDKIAYPRTVAGVSRVELRQTVRGVDTTKVLVESPNRLARVSFPRGGNPTGVLYAEIFEHLNAGQAFQANLRSVKE